MKKNLFFLFILFSFNGFAQEFEKTIEDNSFLIEEAYNQENNIVQHISNYNFNNQNGYYSFTQEWPIFSKTHQFSYIISLNENQKFDIDGINYRLQIIDDYDLAIAPRISIKKEETKFGYEINLPISKRFSNRFVNHFNIGLTHFQKSNLEYFIGASEIFILNKNLNLLCEMLFSSSEKQFVINPGIRHAFDIENLQIVSGFSLPFEIKKNGSEKNIFLYLSFEHPF